MSYYCRKSSHIQQIIKNYQEMVLSQQLYAFPSSLVPMKGPSTKSVNHKKVVILMIFKNIIAMSAFQKIVVAELFCMTNMVSCKWLIRQSSHCWKY